MQGLSPWARIAPRAPPPPPQILHEWYHFVQETRLIDYLRVTSKNVGMNKAGRPFFKMAAIRNWFCLYISVYETHRDLILVSIPMFSGSRNSIRPVIITLDHLVKAAILIFKMATNQICFFPYLCIRDT